MDYYSAPSVYGEVLPINMTDNRTVGVLLVGINAVLYFAVPGNLNNTSLFYLRACFAPALCLRYKYHKLGCPNYNSRDTLVSHFMYL